MKALKTIFIVFWMTLPARAICQIYNAKYGSPVIVFTKKNPWLMVIGSDVPQFVVYENGQVIYEKQINKEHQYFEVTLPKKDIQKTALALGITDTVLKLPPYIAASESTDQPTNQLLLNFDTLSTKVVYGNLKPGGSDARLKTPGAFLNVYDKMTNYNNPGARPWLPDSIEVMLTDYSYAPEKSLLWPKDWPGLNDKSTKKRSDDLYSIYLDKKHFNAFRKLVSSLKEKQAVDINGKKFAVSYRLPFPNIR